MSTETFLDGRQLCRELGVSRVTLLRRVKDGTIPAIKIGHLVRYDKEAVFAALRKSRLSVAKAAVDGRGVTVASALMQTVEND